MTPWNDLYSTPSIAPTYFLDGTSYTYLEYISLLSGSLIAGLTNGNVLRLENDLNRITFNRSSIKNLLLRY